MSRAESTDSCASVEDIPWDSDATQIYEASAIEKALWEQNLDEENAEREQTLDEERCDGNNPQKKQKVHGGARNLNSYEQKIHCMDISFVRNFLYADKCGCGNNCVQKLRSHGAQGVEVVSGLRQARFAGIRSSNPKAVVTISRLIFFNYPGV